MKISDIGGLKIGDTVAYSFGSQSTKYCGTVVQETDSGGYKVADDLGSTVLYPDAEYHSLQKI